MKFGTQIFSIYTIFAVRVMFDEKMVTESNYFLFIYVSLSSINRNN